MNDHYNRVLDTLCELADFSHFELGRIVHFSIRGESRGKKSGRYFVREYTARDGTILYYGWCGTWKEHSQGNWIQIEPERSATSSWSQEERDDFHRQREESRREEEEQRRRETAEATTEAKKVLEDAKPAGDDHAYLVSKKVKSYGLKEIQDEKWGRMLLIPMYQNSGGGKREISGYQYITEKLDPDTGKPRKRFKHKCSTKGAYFIIPGDRKKGYFIVEGYATGASVHEATGAVVVVAFSANNLLLVAECLRKAASKARIIIAADDDYQAEREGKGNAGRTKGQAAAQAINAEIRFPVFADDNHRGTDWNDLHQIEGLDQVREQLTAEAQPAKFADPERHPEPPDPCQPANLTDLHRNTQARMKDFIIEIGGICSEQKYAEAINRIMEAYGDWWQDLSDGDAQTGFLALQEQFPSSRYLAKTACDKILKAAQKKRKDQVAKEQAKKEKESTSGRIYDYSHLDEVCHDFMRSRGLDAPKAIFYDGSTEEYLEFRGGRYIRIGTKQVRGHIFDFTSRKQAWGQNGSLERFSRNAKRIREVEETFRNMSIILGRDQSPCWIDLETRETRPCSERFIPMKNGRLNVERWMNGERDPGKLFDGHTPEYLNECLIPHYYSPEAQCPNWEQFVDGLFPEDPTLIDTLQEAFGYYLSGLNTFHKIITMTGVMRSGKGVCTRILQEMMGAGNYVGTDLKSLGTQFGLRPLMGKSLAVLPDEIVSRQTDVQEAVNRIKRISGGDSVSIDIKNVDVNKSFFLPTRFLVVANEQLNLPDNSRALANRWVFIPFTVSHLHREDHGLQGRVERELPGIINWSLKGLERLLEQGHFTIGRESEAARASFEELSAPFATFVRECLDITGQEEHQMSCADVRILYLKWCETTGHKQGTSLEKIASNLVTQYPKVKRKLFWERDGSTRRQVRGLTGVRENFFNGLEHESQVV